MNIIKKSFFKRFWALALVCVTVLSMGVIAPVKASAQTTYNGGWAFTTGQLTVYDDQACTVYKGKVYENESFTVLNKYSNGVYWIEYSTSTSTPKNGYIKPSEYVNERMANSCVATANTATNVYYGNSSSAYLKAGSISAGERVVVLSKYNGWAFIEYNTANGRKRAYVESSKLTCYNEPAVYEEFHFDISGFASDVPHYYDVFAGPSYTYARVGSVGYNDGRVESVIIRGIYPGDEVSGTTYFIEYNVTGSTQKKSGYIFVVG